MEKRTRKSSKKFLVLEIVLILLIILSLVGTYYFYNELNNGKSKYKKYMNSYNTTSNSLSDLKDKLTEVDNELNDYKDIDGKIESVKSEYFSKIKALEDEILAGNSNRKIAYLTFDDGPYYNTHRILEILDEADVKATFFTISMNGEYCYDRKSENCFSMYKEYLKRGHTIANHTYTHAIRNGLYNSVDSFINAIERQDAHIKNMTGGYTPNIVRFPGGSSTAKNLKDPIIERLKSMGYGWTDWTAVDGDGTGLSSNEQAWNNIYNTVKDNIEVILLHDYNTITTAILPDLIKYLKDNGYECYPLFYESNMINK